MTPKDKPLTSRYLVAHFGNGDEDDQTLIQTYASSFGQLSRITIFPGISYGHLEFQRAEEGAKMLADLEAENVKVL